MLLYIFIGDKYFRITLYRETTATIFSFLNSHSQPSLNY